MKTRFVSLGLLGLLLGACSVDATGENAGESAGDNPQPIVRGAVETRFPQVVFLHIERPGRRPSSCTGVYAAPRVVITAAHCIFADTIPGRFFVYHGADYETDVADIDAIPPPGTPSPWSKAESWAQHPDYVPSLGYPDLAVVYLDRKLPFAPMALYEHEIGKHFIGDKATTVGWGANVALSADITVNAGGGVKRSGRQKILGTPTRADFDPADPNFGLLFPSIRADLIKLDGTAPRPNTCAGDSGGPFLIEKRGAPQVGGISFFTGQFCEGYSMYTRIDPFLKYFKREFERAGRAAVKPQVDCVTELGGGAFRAYFGYDNDNGITMEIPHGRDNELDEDVNDERPTTFAPGEHSFQFAIEFTARERLVYELEAPHARNSSARADARSPRCDVNDQEFICAQHCEASAAAACDDGSYPFRQCQADCLGFTTDLFAGCETEWNAYLRCHAAVPPAEENWLCSPGTQSQPITCDPEFFEALACAGF